MADSIALYDLQMSHVGQTFSEPLKYHLTGNALAGLGGFGFSALLEYIGQNIRSYLFGQGIVIKFVL